MLNLHTRRFRLYGDGRLEVYDHELATRINRELKTYDGGRYRFVRGEEGVFKLRDQIETTRILSKFLAPRSTLAQGAATTPATPGAAHE